MFVVVSGLLAVVVYGSLFGVCCLLFVFSCLLLVFLYMSLVCFVVC